MTVQPADVYDMLKKIRYDATAIQAKVTDALNMLAELNLPQAPQLRCPHCDLAFRGRLPLDEHVYNSHGGPVPAHWLAIEARSESDDVDRAMCEFVATKDGIECRCGLFATHGGDHFLIPSRSLRVVPT